LRKLPRIPALAGTAGRMKNEVTMERTSSTLTGFLATDFIFFLL